MDYSNSEASENDSEQRSWLFTAESLLCAALSVSLASSLISYGVAVYRALYADVNLSWFLVIVLTSFEWLIVGVAVALRPLASLLVRNGSLWVLAASSVSNWVLAYILGDLAFIFWILFLRWLIS